MSKEQERETFRNLAHQLIKTDPNATWPVFAAFMASVLDDLKSYKERAEKAEEELTQLKPVYDALMLRFEEVGIKLQEAEAQAKDKN